MHQDTAQVTALYTHDREHGSTEPRCILMQNVVQVSSAALDLAYTSEVLVRCRKDKLAPRSDLVSESLSSVFGASYMSLSMLQP